MARLFCNCSWNIFSASSPPYAFCSLLPTLTLHTQFRPLTLCIKALSFHRTKMYSFVFSWDAKIPFLCSLRRAVSYNYARTTSSLPYSDRLTIRCGSWLPNTDPTAAPSSTQHAAIHHCHHWNSGQFLTPMSTLASSDRYKGTARKIMRHDIYDVQASPTITALTYFLCCTEEANPVAVPSISAPFCAVWLLTGVKKPSLLTDRAGKNNYKSLEPLRTTVFVTNLTCSIKKLKAPSNAKISFHFTDPVVMENFRLLSNANMHYRCV